MKACSGSGAPSRPPTQVPPTREHLIALFGSAEVVDRLLLSLFHEAGKDCSALVHALEQRDAVQTVEHLHRLVGSLAFLGEQALERQGVGLIGAVRRMGIAVNRGSLARFQQDLARYLDDLARI